MSADLDGKPGAEPAAPSGDSGRRQDVHTRRRLTQVITPKMAILVGIVAVIAWFAIVPLVYLLWGTFFEGGTATIEPFRRAFRAIGIGTLSYNTLVFAVGATVLSTVIGTLLAYLTERTDIRFKTLIFAASLVPLIIPGILYTISWVFLASPRIGMLNGILEPVFGPGTFDVFTLTGMIVVQGLDNTPLVFLLMVAAFRSMDPSLEESALMSGSTLPRVFRTITLPLVKPALFAALLIMLVRNIEAFETPALLGMPNGIWVFTSRIWRVMSEIPADYGQAGVYSIILIAISMVGIFFYSRFNERAKSFQTVTGKGFRPHPLPLGKWRNRITWAVLAYFFVAIILPTLTLLYMSTQPFYSVPSADALSRVSFDNYVYIATHSQTVRAFTNSFLLAIATGTIVMFVTAIGSWLVVRSKLPGAWTVDALAFTPMVVPGLVLGVALIFVYIRFPVTVYGTLWILLIAYITRLLPYGMRYATTSMYQIGGELEESAQMSGASWWQVFRRVNLPLLMPGLLAGWLFIVMTSVRELSSSILLYSPGTEVLAVLIWEQYDNGQFTELAALGIVLIILLIILVIGVQQLGKRVGVRR